MADIKVYGAPWCPDCKRSKKFLAEHRVLYDWIDVDKDPAGLQVIERIQQGGHRIPTILFPDGTYLIEPGDEELARKLGLTLEASRSFYDLAIVGGGPAGLAAAIYAAREGMDAIVVDQSGLGGQAGVTERIDNYPGFPEGIGGAELAERFVAQCRRYGVELLSAVQVRSVAQEGEDAVLHLSTNQEICAHAVLLATGSHYRRLGVPGEEALIGSGVHFCATCDGPFYKGSEELIVIGGGNSGLEEGLFLSRFAKRIRIVEFMPELKASKLLQDKVLNHPQFEVHTNTQIVGLRGRNKLEAVVGRNRATGEEYEWHPAGAFVFIGLQPNTDFVRSTVELDKWGFVVTNNRYQTNMPQVFCAGDVRQGSTKQLGAAIGEGISALLSIREYLKEHHHLPEKNIDG